MTGVPGRGHPAALLGEVSLRLLQGFEPEPFAVAQLFSCGFG